MGFPTWTIWGMGLSAAGALVVIALAYIGQSPGFMRRVGLDVYRLDLRVRAFTGYAFALLLLAIGFFLAGVPLSPTTPDTAQASESLEPAAEIAASTSGPESDMADSAGIPGASGAMTAPDSAPEETDLLALTVTPAPTSSTPVSGAFGGPPRSTATSQAGSSATDEPTEEADPPEDVAASTTPTPDTEETAPAAATSAATDTSTAATATPTPTTTPSPTATASPTPTITPSPTTTPTPIVGETATVNGDGASVWIYRSPGGQQLALVPDGGLVILLPGHANQGGKLWQEVMTVEGVAGWIDIGFLIYDEEAP